MRWLTIGLATLGLSLLLVALCGAAWQHVATARDQVPPPGVLVDVGGRRLHLRCEGAGHGATVVMIAGGGIPAVASYALQDRIAAFSRVCSYDRAGLGWSDPSPRPLGVVEQARDLETLLRKGRVDGPIVLVPESFGALVALSFAERNPGRVAGIAFVDGAEPQTWFETMGREGAWPSRLKEMAMMVGWRTGVVRLLLPRLEPTWVADLPTSTRAQFRSVFSRPNPGWGDALDAYQHTAPTDRPSSASGVLGQTPILVLRHQRESVGVGKDFEAIWPRAQSILAKLGTGPVQVVEMKDTGHAMAQEQPVAVAEHIRAAFFSGRPKQRGS